MYEDAVKNQYANVSGISLKMELCQHQAVAAASQFPDDVDDESTKKVVVYDPRKSCYFHLDQFD